ncbi:MAG: hypothetical protein WA354_03430 [Terracidiphilus sp.]
MGMTQSGKFGFSLVAAGAIFLCLNIPRMFNSPGSMMDFRTAYSSARCLLRRCDPYNPKDVLRIYKAEGGARSSDSDADRFSLPRNNYLPLEFAVTVPFALLPFGVAQALWVVLTVGSFVMGAFLMWDLGAYHAPELAGGLVGFLLAYSEQIVFYGNLAGFAVPFCMIAVWCFLRNKFLMLGTMAFAISLAVKPHDVVLVWVYFLLAGGTFRKWALRTAAVAAAFSLPTVLWVTHIAPYWIQELRSNIQAFGIHGGGIDVSLAAIDNHGTCLIANLQSVFAVFRDDPRFYNHVTYFVFAPMLLVWSIVTLRARLTLATTWLAIAAIAPLSMLPMYHRIYDAKIIMLTIPACALLWAEGGRIGRLALIITAASCVVTGDLVWSVYFEILVKLRLLPAVSPGPLLGASINIPLPLSLLVLAGFYLVVYVRRASFAVSKEEPAHLEYAATPHT